MHFSVLDRANRIAGLSESEVLLGVIDHARQAEALGFRRFFVAEHHAVPGLPGSQPGMLATAVGAATDAIRVGTAGIMLPDHQPLIVAEQIATLEALYPGRIDAGIGSSVGFTAPVRAALRQGDVAELKKRYPDDLRELLSFLNGSAPVTARPFNDSATPVFVLAGFRSALLAAELGLGVILGGPNQVDAARLYRKNFRPGLIDAPHVILSYNVAVADTEAAARDLLIPEAWAQAKARTTGSFGGLEPLADLDESVLRPQERRLIEETLATDLYGTPAQVAARAGELLRAAGAEEILATAGMSDLAGRARSEELLAEMSA
ncbi:MsnO8 family LLM class oxidoreductase [Corynebacterium sp. YIM 101645]|uniref:MsnO8 family LLM class oxidoreductase n=1 Tax=Corynebacterium lemuris TaxID=1859292 RepID=A0ABT2FZY9_9CORY|nr:MsnO8 family LLM class oxidoreductase [Corynebacterium lemuris]MCS5480305.1 MsnO8 family LLM class oxidoreductase [Corynebacterium lemuris]